MKRFLSQLRVFLVGMITVSLLAFPATAETEQVMKVRLIKPLLIEKTDSADSAIINLTKEAREYGLHRAVLYGETAYEKQPDGTTRTRINWNSVGMASGAGSKEGVVSIKNGALYSQFRTTDARVDANSELTVRGDLSALAAALEELKNQEVKEEEKKVSENNTENNKTTLTPQAAQSSYSGDSGRYSNSDDGIKSELVTTNFEACSDRVDTAALLVFPQHKEIQMQGSEVVSEGKCVDTGTSFPLQKEECGTEPDIESLKLYKKYKLYYYKDGTEMPVAACVTDKNDFSAIPTQRVYGEDCGVFVDYSSNKVYRKYKDIASVNGIQVEVNACTIDYESSYDLLETTEGCSVRHDFENKISYQQTKKYYQNNNAEFVVVQTCQDSTSDSFQFDQYTTTNTCNYFYDASSGKAFRQERTAYYVNGVEFYASDCSPVGEGFEVEEEACSERYDHDFDAGQSYLMTRKFYTDNGEKEYVTSCARSATVSYPIQYDPTGCSHNYDNQNLQMTWRKTAFLDDAELGRHEIYRCQEVGEPEAYIYSASVQRHVIHAQVTKANPYSGTWTVPKGVTSVTAHVVAPGEAGKGATANPNPYYPPISGANGKGGRRIIDVYPVTPDDTVQITISSASTKFLNATAAQGGHIDSTGYSIHGANLGEGGVGQVVYQCGTYLDGNGVLQVNYCTRDIGPGGPGGVVIEWQVKSYIRPDGTTYLQGD